ncbi:hypothetical protein SLEP1_g32035 [Rubroshorea leprosula]|uniref:Uncharacterized protein n=1 Tax=Rubroshorea leprosula TaxID=152421 RepID=A0AAV5KC80_9ROSI|nr:hypothetical protein SLEP1_g32035 [Rubroshorea leprosula]
MIPGLHTKSFKATTFRWGCFPRASSNTIWTHLRANSMPTGMLPAPSHSRAPTNSSTNPRSAVTSPTKNLLGLLG